MPRGENTRKGAQGFQKTDPKDLPGAAGVAAGAMAPTVPVEPGENATPEAVAAWRTYQQARSLRIINGEETLPDGWEAYPSGATFSDADQKSDQVPVVEYIDRNRQATYHLYRYEDPNSPTGEVWSTDITCKPYLPYYDETTEFEQVLHEDTAPSPNDLEIALDSYLEP